MTNDRAIELGEGGILYARKICARTGRGNICSLVRNAQEVTLRAVTAFAEKTTYSRGFETFIERVNADGKGTIQINYIGGPKAMPPFEVGNALKTGVVDIANTTGAFTTNVMPESDAWKLTERPMSELRKNGGYDYMAKL